jgi:hypothetical protein
VSTLTAAPTEPAPTAPATRRSRSRNQPRLGRLLSNVELVTAILLGVVSVTTAYASFQAALYDGETAKQFTQGQNAQTEAESLYLEANQQYIRDVQLWDRMTELSIEMGDSDPARAAIAQAQFQTLEFQSVSERLSAAILWSNGQNDANPDEYVSPFDSEDYVNTLYADWAKEDAKSIAAFEAGDVADKHGDTLTLTTVLMAISLFLLGVAAVARQLAVQFVLIGVSLVIYAVSLVVMLGVPFMAL